MGYRISQCSTCYLQLTKLLLFTYHSKLLLIILAIMMLFRTQIHIIVSMSPTHQQADITIRKEEFYLLDGTSWTTHVNELKFQYTISTTFAGFLWNKFGQNVVELLFIEMCSPTSNSQQIELPKPIPLKKLHKKRGNKI